MSALNAMLQYLNALHGSVNVTVQTASEGSAMFQISVDAGSVSQVSLPQSNFTPDTPLNAFIATTYASELEKQIIRAIANGALGGKGIAARMKMKLDTHLRLALANLVGRGVLHRTADGYKLADLRLLDLVRETEVDNDEDKDDDDDPGEVSRPYVPESLRNGHCRF